MTTPRSAEKKNNQSEKITAALVGAIFVIFICNWMKTESYALKSATFSASNLRKPNVYIPASTEDYTMSHLVELGYDKEMAEACKIYKSPQVTTPENHANLLAFRHDLDRYVEAIQNFDGSKVKDIRQTIRDCPTCDLKDICKTLRPHPDGIEALFPSQQLSYTKAGFVEPLDPIMRNPHWCDNPVVPQPMDIDYIIHDFEAMCLNLKPHSQIVLLDLGADLNFHSRRTQPVISLMQKFEKFGFQFDHIYAFEVTEFNPKEVYEDLLPEEYFKAYHWINTGVSPDRNSKMNPWYSILSKFSEDDLVIVKLDIDTAEIENPLAHNLLEDDSINKLVDHFYFEHHVVIAEYKPIWRQTMKGTIQESFHLMNGLRRKGVGSHYWI